MVLPGARRPRLSHETNGRYAEIVSHHPLGIFAAGDIRRTSCARSRLESLRYQTAMIDADSEYDLARHKLAVLMGLGSADALPQAVVYARRAARRRCRCCWSARRSSGPTFLRAAVASSGRRQLSSAKREALSDISLSINYTHSEFTASEITPTPWAWISPAGAAFLIAIQANIGRARVDERRADNSIERVWLGAARSDGAARWSPGRSSSRGVRSRRYGGARRSRPCGWSSAPIKTGAASLLELLEAQRTHLDTKACICVPNMSTGRASSRSHAVAGEVK